MASFCDDTGGCKTPQKTASPLFKVFILVQQIILQNKEEEYMEKEKKTEEENAAAFHTSRTQKESRDGGWGGVGMTVTI